MSGSHEGGARGWTLRQLGAAVYARVAGVLTGPCLSPKEADRAALARQDFGPTGSGDVQCQVSGLPSHLRLVAVRGPDDCDKEQVVIACWAQFSAKPLSHERTHARTHARTHGGRSQVARA